MLLNFKKIFRSVPVVLQSEASECGIACICSVLNYFGSRESLRYLRDRANLSASGLSISDLQQLAEERGLAARVLRIEMNDLENVSLPAVVHWGLNHFVVMTKIKGDIITIVDPAAGRREVSKKLFSKYFTGFLMELRVTEQFKKKKQKKYSIYAYLFKLGKQFKSSLKVTALLSLFAQIFLLTFPLYYRILMDEVSGTNDKELLSIIAVFFLSLAIFHLYISILRAKEEMYIGTNVMLQTVNNILRHLFFLPLKYFENRTASSIVSRITGTRAIERAISTEFINVIIDSILAALILFILFTYNVNLAFIFLVTILLYALMAYLYYNRSKELEINAVIASSEEQNTLFEAIDKIQTTKLYGQELSQLNAWENKYIENLNITIQMSLNRIMFSKFSEFLMSGNRIAVLYVAMLLTFENLFTVGQFFAVFMYGAILLSKAQGLVNALLRFLQLRIRLDRMADILEEKPERFKNGTYKAELKGAIKFTNIQFSYSAKQKNRLRNINFSIKPGEFVVFTGPSGCGKTTLIKLLLGLYAPDSGGIHFDSIKSIDYYQKCLRDQIASVMQEDKLISGSILRNIALYDENVDIKKVEQVAKLALIYDEIDSLPMKFETQVRPSGGALSAGQRQRVILARALYKEPKILVMDEGSAFLDIETERKLNATLRNMNITRISIAHRVESIGAGDRLFVYSDNKFVESPEKLASIKTALNNITNDDISSD